MTKIIKVHADHIETETAERLQAMSDLAVLLQQAPDIRLHALAVSMWVNDMRQLAEHMPEQDLNSFGQTMPGMPNQLKDRSGAHSNAIDLANWLLNISTLVENALETP